MGGFFRTQREFRDFHELEEFQQSLNLPQQPTQITQLERGRPCIRSTHVGLGNVKVSLFEISHRVRLEDQLRPSKSVLVFNLRPPMDVTWNGVPFPQWGVALMRGGHSYDIVHQSGFASVEITLPDALLSDYGLIEPDADPAQIALSEAEARLLACRFSLLVNATPHHGSNLQAAAVRQRVLATCASLLDRLDAAAHGTIPDQPARARVARAEEIIESRLQGALDLPYLATAIGVSPRTLRRDFLKVLGATPKAYQLARRLEAAKKALREGGGRSVADVSDQYGFSHPSRFAEHYKRQFGESPSSKLWSSVHVVQLEKSSASFRPND